MNRDFHEFTLVLSPSVREEDSIPDLIDAIYALGFGDSVVDVSRRRVISIEVDRKAPTRQAAIDSALAQLKELNDFTVTVKS